MSAEAIQIRVAEPEDAAAISACLRAAFEPYRALYAAGAFADTSPEPEGVTARFGAMQIFVACAAGGGVVGTLGFSAEGGEGHLRGMGVRPECQGLGVAEALMRRVEDAMRQCGCVRVTLDVTEPLARAIRLYERLGYVRTGRVGEFFGMPLHEFAKGL